MANRRWVRQSPLLERLAQWQLPPLNRERITTLGEFSTAELRALAGRVGRLAWVHRDDAEALTVLRDALRLGGRNGGADELAVMRQAYSVAMCAVLDAVLAPEGVPFLLKNRLTEIVETILAGHGATETAVDAALAGAVLRPLLQDYNEDGPRQRRYFRESIATLSTALDRLDAAALKGTLPDPRQIPAYQELRGLQTVLSGMLSTVPIGTGVSTQPQLAGAGVG